MLFAKFTKKKIKIYKKKPHESMKLVFFPRQKIIIYKGEVEKEKILIFEKKNMYLFSILHKVGYIYLNKSSKYNIIYIMK